MNKNECKKYIRRAYKNLVAHNKSLNISNIEYEMEDVLKRQKEEYIAYSKIAVNNMKKSGNLEITLNDILSQIDVLPNIYTSFHAINVAKKL